MTLDTFFEKFDQFADAPDAVAKMRKIVLALAVQGKLAPQDQDDEPADKTLEKVLRRRRHEAKSLRLKEPSPVEADEEHTPGLPIGWCYASPDQLTAFHKNALTIGPFGSSLLKSDYTDKGVPLVFVRDIRSESFGGPETRFVTPEKAEELASHTVRSGDLLITKMGDPPGDTAIYPVGRPPAIITADCIKLTPHSDLVSAEYLRFTIRASQIAEQFAGITLGVAQQKVSLGRFRCIAIPLPPLAEQKRIVAKVDELMALCDRLEAQQQERDEQASALARASLARFAEAPTAANLNLLFHKDYSIPPADLRKSVLTLAVQGKLVPQDPNDEPAEDSLAQNDERRCETARHDNRVDEEKQPLLSGDDRWDIADTWSWRGLADLVVFVDYRGKTPAKLSSGVRLLTAKNVRKGQINLSPEEFLSESEYHTWMTRGFPKAGDVLFTTEAPMGNAAVVELTERFALAQRVICFQSYGAIDPAFLVLQILSEQFQFILDKNGTGVTAKGIKASKLKQLPIAVPPLAEQRRIVAKVDQLMTLVDQLETQLDASRATAKNLLESLVVEITQR